MADGLIIAAVAATLRKAAFWGLSFDTGPAQEELLDIARQVESLDADGDLCCPVCEESECDSDCPLAAVRARRASTPPLPCPVPEEP